MRVQLPLFKGTQHLIDDLEEQEIRLELQDKFERDEIPAAFRCETCEKEFGFPAPYSKDVYNTPWEVTSHVHSYCSEECEQADSPGYYDFAPIHCDMCGRDIIERNPANGYMYQFRDLDGAEVCLKCYEEHILENGVDIEVFEKGQVAGMFFSGDNSEPIEAGYEKVEDYDDVKVNDGNKQAFLKKCIDLINDGYKVLVGYERMSIIGDEGFVTMWRKKKECDPASGKKSTKTARSAETRRSRSGSGSSRSRTSPPRAARRKPRRCQEGRASRTWRKSSSSLPGKA